MSPEVTPNGPARKFVKEIERHAAGSRELLEKNFGFELEMMFGSGIEEKDLTPEERIDIENFITFAAKRLANGVVSSQAFHREIIEKGLSRALNKWAGSFGIGHDVIHSMMAYSRTDGASLIPAYMRVSNVKEVETDDAALLEEAYVQTFSNLNGWGGLRGLREIISSLVNKGLSGDALVIAAVEAWETEHQQYPDYEYSSSQYPKENRLPEFVAIVRNLATDLQSGNSDPKFPIYEFRRILRPLLDRLQSATF